MTVDAPNAVEEPTDKQLESLRDALTQEEKISLLSGENIWETHAIPRLNIPSLKVTSPLS